MITIAVYAAIVIVVYSCEKDSDTVIDPSISAPLISGQFQSLDTVETTSSSPLISFYTSVIADRNGGEQITSVSMIINDPLNNELASINLTDNGTLPDTIAGDGKYSAIVSLSNINCLLVGNYSLEYIALNNSGLYSNLITSDIYVKNSFNAPPVISGTNLPDSIVRPLPGDSLLLTISVTVSDPDGLCDLKDVSFVTVRPNGVILPAIPMFYNGNGEFLFSNYVLPSSDPSSFGYFKYTFTPKDRSNVSGASVTDSIKFVMPG
ncbi:MAG: hypothetical protein HGGPFJEG_01213 [Ignavibacteria bacterium]|nr:hypothetical protein [Ignavibacteria bacterium]